LATVLALGLVVLDVDLLVVRGLAAAAFDGDRDDEPLRATLELRALPRTTSSWPG
jgi:hypothetical protein